MCSLWRIRRPIKGSLKYLLLAMVKFMVGIVGVFENGRQERLGITLENTNLIIGSMVMQIIP